MSLTGTPVDFLTAFIAGVVVSFTPCVYPVIPIVAAAIAGANTSGRALGGFFLSLLYVLGLALSYSLLAFFAAWTGKFFGVFQNNPLVFFAVGNVFLIFALMMMDVIPSPSFSFGGPVRRKGAFPILLMGIASGFVVGPCTFPVLGSILLYVASRQNVFFAGSLLFVFSLGAGMSLILAGTFSGFLSSLPKSGAWLNAIKKFVGIVLLGFAEYYFMKAGQLF